MGVTRRYHPFYWTSQPTLAFTVGTGATYSLAQHITNPLGLAITYSARTTLPSGLSLNPQTGLLTYTGSPAATATVQFAIADANFSSESSRVQCVLTQPEEPPPGNQPPQWISTPVVSFTLGTAGTYELSQHVLDPEGDDVDYTLFSGTWPSGVTLDEATGRLTYDGTGSLEASNVVTVDAFEVQSSGAQRIASIPEQIFLSGYAEDEELGIYLLDGENRTAHGDLWWLNGGRLKNTSGGNYAPGGSAPTLTVVTGALPPGLTFDAATARLRYTGTDPGVAVHDCTVRLTWGSSEQVFRIRVLRPTVIYTDSAGTLPAQYAGIPTYATSTAWSTVRADGASGTNDASPRVVFFHTFTSRKDWFIGNASTNSKWRYMYLVGVPGTLTQLGEAHSVTPLGFELFSLARFRSWHFKNLIFGNVGLVTGIQESAFPTRWSIQKCDWLDRNNQTSSSNVENGSDWAPNTFPSQEFDFRFWAVNLRMHQAGNQFGLKHGFYVETIGYTFADFNNIRVNGAAQCSCVQTVVGSSRLRNSYLSAVVDEDDPYASTLWAAELFDPHAHGEVICYNNTLVGARDQALRPNGGTRNAVLAYLANRRPARGSPTPLYPSLSWGNPATSGGAESPLLGAFPPGPATFKNPAFWTTAFAGGSTNPLNPYLFRKFYAHNTVRTAAGTPTRPRLTRVDGSHPCEVVSQGSDPTIMLGTPPEWFERCTVFLLNNTYEDWTAAEATLHNFHVVTDSQNVTAIENGALMEARTVTLDTGETGTIRIRSTVQDLRDASASVRTRINWTGVTAPGAFDTFAELQTVLQSPDAWTADPVRWPAARWPSTATGPGTHSELEGFDPYVSRIVGIGTGFGHRYSDQPSNAQVPTPAYFLDASASAETPTESVLQAAIDAIPAPYSFGPLIDCPTLNQTSPRLDPFNPDGEDYPDNAGGQTTNTYDKTRAWIWASRACYDPVKRRVFKVFSPHGFDEFNGYNNGFLTLLTFYDEDTNSIVVMENPFTTTGTYTGVPNGVQVPIAVGHGFDTDCISGRHLLKWTLPINPGGGQGFRGPQLMQVNMDVLTTDVASGRNAASNPVNLGRPADTFPLEPDINDITAPAVDVFPNGDFVMLHKSRIYRRVAATGAWTITELGFAVDNAFHNVGHYHPNTGLFIGGGGAYAGTGARNFEFITMDQAGNVTHLDNALQSYSVSETDVGGEEVKAVFVPDPNSTESLVFIDNGNVRAVDPTRPPGQQWRLVGTMSGMSGGAVTQIDWAAALWGRGAILVGKSNEAGAAWLRVYRGA